MKKSKLYLDTSVISHLEAPDAPEQMRDTIKLWSEIKAGAYDIVLSDMAIDEVAQCHQPKRDKLFAHLAAIDYLRVDGNDEIDRIAAEVIRLGILKEKDRDDCVHIGTAIVSRCDYIVSWNFKHMVNVKTIKGVRAITNLHGYSNVDIIQPTMLIEKED